MKEMKDGAKEKVGVKNGKRRKAEKNDGEKYKKQ